LGYKDLLRLCTGQKLLLPPCCGLSAASINERYQYSDLLDAAYKPQCVGEILVFLLCRIITVLYIFKLIIS